MIELFAVGILTLATVRYGIEAKKHYRVFDGSWLRLGDVLVDLADFLTYLILCGRVLGWW